MKNNSAQALLEQYYEPLGINRFLCDNCGSFFLTFDERDLTDTVHYEDKRLCLTCEDAACRSKYRECFPANPYNLKNWIDVDTKLEHFKCYGECQHNVDKRHSLSYHHHGAVGTRRYVFRKDIMICEICFLDFATGVNDKKGLEDAANC